MEQLFQYIDRYIDLSVEDKLLIASHGKIRHYLKGQYIVQQGDISDCENFVVRGCARTFYLDREGNEHVVKFAIKNWWVGDLGSFISREPATYHVQCLDSTEVVQFTYDVMEYLYRKVPLLERFFRLIIQKAYVASEKRIIANFSMTARERYLDFLDKYPEIEQMVPQYMIASYIGITKEFLSKIRSELRKEDSNLINLD